SAKNQNYLSRFVSKCFKRFDCRVDAGSFRIVVELYAINSCTKPQPMFDRLKIPDRLAHRIGSGAASKPGSNSRQHILYIVQPAKFHLIRHYQDTLTTGRPGNNLAASQEEPFFQFSLDAEAGNMRAQTLRPAENDFVVGVKNRDIARPLIHENAMLSGRIVSKGFVTIHMIWRNVQSYCNCRM